MSRSRTSPAVYLVALFVLAALLSLATADPSASPPAPIPSASPAAVPDLSGAWTGTWNDTVYLVGGDVTMTATLDGAAWSAVGSIDLSSIGVPGVGLMSGTAQGTLAGNTLTFEFSAVDVGDGDGTLIDGSGSGSGTVTAPMSFGAFTFTGTVTDSSIDGDFDFTSPTGGAGTVTLARAVGEESATWSDLKSSWR
jgi:hypothetical protein